MGLFNKKEKDSTNNHVANMAKAAQTAVDYAWDFRVKLDYSPRSVEGLESILAYYSEGLSRAHPTEDQIWSMASIFGAYLGELMLKNGLSDKGYAWGMDEQGGYPVLLSEEGFIVAPIDKVFKRFVNGAEDNVVSFYTYGMEEIGGLSVDSQ